MAAYRPANWPTLIPRLSSEDPEALVQFIRHVFNATGEYQENRPSELFIDESLIMIAGTLDRAPAAGFLYVYVEDADATFAKAVAAGAETIEAPLDTPYGDRRAMVTDPWGNRWQIATHSGFKTQ